MAIFRRNKAPRRLVRKLNRETPEHWSVERYDPKEHEAPPGHPDHDCDGTDDEDRDG